MILAAVGGAGVWCERGHQSPMASRWFAFAAAGLACVAGCGTGQQFGAGPVLGYAVGRGLVGGWEAGAAPITIATTAGDPVPSPLVYLTRFNVGMSWRPGPAAGAGNEQVTYLVWEPWFLVGGTLGV